MTDEQQYGVVTGLHWHAADWLMAEAGGDVQWQRNRSLRWTTDRRRIVTATRDQDFDLTVGGGFVQAIVTPARWLTVTPAWRIDRVGGSYTHWLNGIGYPLNDYGTISQPNLSVVLAPVAGVTAYGNFGRTFQIGAGSGSFVVPARVRDLEPSTNEGYEAGIKLAQGRWLTVRAAVWRQTASGELRRRLNDRSPASGHAASRPVKKNAPYAIAGLIALTYARPLAYGHHRSPLPHQHASAYFFALIAGNLLR